LRLVYPRFKKKQGQPLRLNGPTARKSKYTYRVTHRALVAGQLPLRALHPLIRRLPLIYRALAWYDSEGRDILKVTMLSA